MKLTIKRILVIIFFAFLYTIPVLSQDDDTVPPPGSPEEPSIMLPEIFLEIEDLTAEKLDAVLPPGEELSVPETDIPLPELTPMGVSDETFVIPLPSISGAAAAVDSGESSFYSTGLIGIGTMNNILGSVSLYKLGDEPRFTFQFSHESADGYNFNPPGTGYFRKTDDLAGWISFRTGSAEIRGEGGYSEDEKGLQQQASYYAAALKKTSGNFNFSLESPRSPLFLNAGFSALSLRRILASATSNTEPVSHRETKLSGNITAGADFSSVTFHLSADYFYRFVPTVTALGDNRLFVETGFDAALRDIVVLDGSAGFAYGDTFKSAFPFDLSLSFILKDSVVLSLAGGYQVVTYNYNELWEDFRLLNLQDTLEDGSEWFADGGFKLQNRTRSLYLEGGIGSAYRIGVVELGNYDESSGFYPFTQRDYITLSPRAKLYFSPGKIFDFSLGWEAILLERTAQEDAHRFTWEAGINSSGGRFGATLSGWTALNSWIFDVPVLDFSAYFKATEGVEFILEAEDILSPVIESGRVDLEPFITPGLIITFKTQISL
jgi:hypothetical protein